MDASQSPASDPQSGARQQSQPQMQQQQQQQTAGQQALVVVSSSGGSSSIPLVNSSGTNTVVLSAQNGMSAQTAQLMSQATGVPQNSIRLPIQQQQQQHVIMAPMNNLMFGNYLQGGHPVLTQGSQYITLQNLPTLSNQGIFQLPPNSSNITTISGNRRSTVTSNIQPRPSQLLPAPLSQQVYRTNLSPQLIAQSSGVNTTPANIQPRPQSFLQASPMIRTANLAPQLFAPQSFQQVFSQNAGGGLCWTAGQPGTNSGFILRSQADPIQFLQTQTPLQIPFVQNNVQVPNPPAAVVPAVSVATVQATSQVTTSTTSTPARFKPIATRPAATSTSTSMGTQTAPRTTTTTAELSKSSSRPKVTSGPGRPVPATPTATSKLANGPVVQAREAEATSSARSSPATKTPPLFKSEVSSSNTATPVADPKDREAKPVKTAPTVTGKKEISKEGVSDKLLQVRRPAEKRDAAAGHDAHIATNGSGLIAKKNEPQRGRNGVMSVNDCKKIAEPEKAVPDILIHVIEDYVIEESSKPFPVNGTLDHCENGSIISDKMSNGLESPDEVMMTPRTGLPSDAGECQRCQITGPKSRLKLKNGIRVCATCWSTLSKRPASKLDLFNPVTGCISEYDFPGTDAQPVAKGAAAMESEPVATAADTRKKARLSKKVAVDNQVR